MLKWRHLKKEELSRNITCQLPQLQIGSPQGKMRVRHGRYVYSTSPTGICMSFSDSMKSKVNTDRLVNRSFLPFPIVWTVSATTMFDSCHYIYRSNKGRSTIVRTYDTATKKGATHLGATCNLMLRASETDLTRRRDVDAHHCA